VRSRSGRWGEELGLSRRFRVASWELGLETWTSPGESRSIFASLRVDMLPLESADFYMLAGVLVAGMDYISLTARTECRIGSGRADDYISTIIKSLGSTLEGRQNLVLGNID
jgi:hypothetical protein